LIAEILGGLGIIVSILYLAYEALQSSESMALSHHLNMPSEYMASKQSVITDSGTAKIVVEGNSDVSGLEPFKWLQFEDYVTSIRDIWENGAYMVSIT